MSNLKEIDPREGCLWLAQSSFCKTVQRKMWRKWGNFQKHISCKLLGQFSSNLVCRVTYMEGIKYVSDRNRLSGYWDTRGWKRRVSGFCKYNTVVHHTAFLAADTRLCVLILQTTGPFSSNFVWRTAYMEGINYVNLIEISPLAIEIQEVNKLIFLYLKTRRCKCYTLNIMYSKTS